MTAVHMIVPEGIDDPARPSGGNTFDVRVCRGLAASGWEVHVHEAPSPDAMSNQPSGRAVAWKAWGGATVVVVTGASSCARATEDRGVDELLSICRTFDASTNSGVLP